MLFQAMVIFLPISIVFKILSERGKVHWVPICFSLRARLHPYETGHIFPHWTGLYEQALTRDVTNMSNLLPDVIRYY